MIKLARSVGRIDFWNLHQELTPYQLAVHRAAADIEPFGEDRADIRTAMNTILQMQAMSAKPISEVAIREIMSLAANYLDVNRPPEKVVGSKYLKRLAAE